MGKFKVGDRVRVTDPRLLRTGTPVGAMGTITSVYSGAVTFDLEHPTEGAIHQVLIAAHDYLEPVAVAQQPQPLRIEAGKFYITRDGRKVGPMRRWSDEAKHRWEADADDLPYIWADDGTEIDSDIDDSADLVAEASSSDNGSTDYGSTAGFTVPVCAYEDEPGWYAAELGRAYADGYAAGLRAAA